MSENTPDELSRQAEENPSQEMPSIDESTSEADLPLEHATTVEAEAGMPASGESTEHTESPADASPESSLPPEAQGEANGGPLGCCLGTMVGLLLSLSLALFSRAYAPALVGLLQGNYWLLGLLVRILMGILAFAGAILFGYLGWKLGKRFYREYEPPVRQRRSREKKQRQRM